MGHAWAAPHMPRRPAARWAVDAIAMILVALLVDTVVPWSDALARIALDGAWPWVVAVAGFLLLRVVLAGIYGAARGLLRALWTPQSSSPSRP